MTSTNRAKIEKDAAVFIDAAESLSTIAEPGERLRSPYSCDHIGYVLGLHQGDTTQRMRERFKCLQGRYSALFSPDESGASYWNGWEDANNERILALCFMAAMVKTGDA